MKAGQNTGLMYILLIIIQILIMNYCQFSPYYIITLLPAMILCMPLTVGTVPAMLIAFLMGLTVDLLAEGMLGLNALALVPVAAARRLVIQLFLGQDIIDRKDSLSFRKNGFLKISATMLVLQSFFLAIYINADGAGLRPFWFNSVKFVLSLILSYAFSLLVAKALIPNDKN